MNKTFLIISLATVLLSIGTSLAVGSYNYGSLSTQVETVQTTVNRHEGVISSVDVLAERILVLSNNLEKIDKKLERMLEINAHIN